MLPPSITKTERKLKTSVMPQSVLLPSHGASLVAQTVKDLPSMRETWVQSLGQEDPLEEGMTTHTSILAWRILWIGKPGRLTVLRVAKSQTRLK